jgi:hypothetical protein
MADIPFSCACGTLKGTLLAASPSSGCHAECFCSDCRAAEIFLGQPDPAPGPVGLFQTTGDRIRIETGQDHLAVFAFGRKNLLRWYADCCRTPMFNVLRKPKLGFASVMTRCLSDPSAIGPVVGRGFIPQPNGKVKHIGIASLILGLARRTVVQRVTGRWRQTPFLDPATGEPVRPVHLVTAQERAGLPNARP